jgi:hypothetical protein
MIDIHSGQPVYLPCERGKLIGVKGQRGEHRPLPRRGTKFIPRRDFYTAGISTVFFLNGQILDRYIFFFKFLFLPISLYINIDLSFYYITISYSLFTKTPPFSLQNINHITISYSLILFFTQIIWIHHHRHYQW